MSSSNASPNISIAGLLRSTKSKGFTVQGSINELIDNAIDANAKNIAVKFNTQRRDLTISDDGCGMNKAVADKAYCLHNDKPASDKNGLYGIGKSVAEGVLSDLQSSTITLTKCENERIYEITAEWPIAISNNTWNPLASGASADIGAPLWNRETINKQHGTIVCIPMTASKYENVVTNIEKIIRGIGYAYQDRRDVTIIVSVDETQYDIDYSDSLGWEDVTEEKRNQVTLEIWFKEGSPNRVYHSEEGTMVRLNRDAVSKQGKSRDAIQAKRINDYNTATEDGYLKQGVFTLRNVYNPTWNPDIIDDEDDLQRGDYSRGHLTFRRNNRHLARFDNDPPNTGDYERRRVLGSIRSSLDYTHVSDKFVKAEGNKSNVTKDNIDQLLLNTVRDIVRKWGDSYYKRYIAPEHVQNVAGNTNSVPKEAVSQFKMNYANPEWRRAYLEFIETFQVI